tara:strand:- start:43 stop:498 length:456 start_codon:yes stop_codon:yes gene_type:complete
MPTVIKNDIIDLSSENKTKELANKILIKLKTSDVVFLYGDMGVGKTTFVRYLVNGLQRENKLKQTEVTSPTFNILNEYSIRKIKINHYDLFRLKSKDELKNLDLFANYKSAITLIEWPELIEVKPKNLIELSFEYDEHHEKRFVQIKGLDL